MIFQCFGHFNKLNFYLLLVINDKIGSLSLLISHTSFIPQQFLWKLQFCHFLNALSQWSQSNYCVWENCIQPVETLFNFVTVLKQILQCRPSVMLRRINLYFELTHLWYCFSHKSVTIMVVFKFCSTVYW